MSNHWRALNDATTGKDSERVEIFMHYDYAYWTIPMTYRIDIQHACSDILPISDKVIMLWAKTALQSQLTSAELTIRLVDPDEMIGLNNTYRQENKTTNVLAFPMVVPKSIRRKRLLLGDVVICPSVLASESQTAHMPLEAHWAHIVIHGILHLLGFDHMETQDEQKMQSLEIALLNQLGYPNPYSEDTKLYGH